MIYSQATGGLGNQFYNYAIGYALAKKNKDELILDISPYRFSPRPYVLDHFTLSYKAVSLFPPRKDNKISRMLARTLRILATNRHGYCTWIKERAETRNLFGNYDFSYKASLYLEGYWQNYRYFDAYHDDLCKEFQLKEEFISDTCSHLVAQCTSEDSVAVHIRRGDYEAEWVLKDTYYHQAFELINKKLSMPHYYIFCEDVNYVKEHYGYLENTTFVTGEYRLSDLEEFYLMSKCRHQITANSTFSWWAAYLNTYCNKTVLAPELLHWTRDYYPESWILLKA